MRSHPANDQKCRATLKTPIRQFTHPTSCLIIKITLNKNRTSCSGHVHRQATFGCDAHEAGILTTVKTCCRDREILQESPGAALLGWIHLGDIGASERGRESRDVSQRQIDPAQSRKSCVMITAKRVERRSSHGVRTTGQTSRDHLVSSE